VTTHHLFASAIVDYGSALTDFHAVSRATSPKPTGVAVEKGVSEKNVVLLASAAVERIASW
jgi:hypothetical protein